MSPPRRGKAKTCRLCKQDCSRRRRITDPEGRYYCRECYDRAKAEIRAHNQRDPATPLTMAELRQRAAQLHSSAASVEASAIDSTDSADAATVQRHDRKVVYRSLLYRLIHPGEMLARFVTSANSAAVVLVVWLLGAAIVTDYVELRQIAASKSGTSTSLHESWRAYWTICVIGGAVAGTIIYFVGGWWFRQRLIWSAADMRDAASIRRLSALGWIMYVFPVLFLRVWETTSFSSPEAAFQFTAAWMGSVTTACVLYAVWCSYSAVIKLFTINRSLAAVWFLVVPGAWYLLTLVGSILIGQALASGVFTKRSERVVS